MDQSALVWKLTALAPAPAAEGVAHLALFGSRARGNANANSDVDLLVDVATDSKFSILNLVGVEQIVSDATGLPANAFMRRSLDEAFYASIRQDIVELF